MLVFFPLVLRSRFFRGAVAELFGQVKLGVEVFQAGHGLAQDLVQMVFPSRSRRVSAASRALKGPAVLVVLVTYGVVAASADVVAAGLLAAAPFLVGPDVFLFFEGFLLLAVGVFFLDAVFELVGDEGGEAVADAAEVFEVVDFFDGGVAEVMARAPVRIYLR